MIELLLSRNTPGERELRSARDPVAVLVWAAAHHALPALAAEAGQSGHGRHDGDEIVGLAHLDSALARLRVSVLAGIEATPTLPISGLVGTPPAHPAGLRPWRRAVAAVVHYRTEAGIDGWSRTGADSWQRVLGARPAQADLAAHFDQVVKVVAECRADIVLAELARYAPSRPPRPSLQAISQNAPHPPESEAAIRAKVVLDPPVWVRADVTARTIEGPFPSQEAISALATHYGDIATTGDPSQSGFQTIPVSDPRFLAPTAGPFPEDPALAEGLGL